MSINCVDVSSYQGNINWDKVKASGVKYAILRSITKGLGTDKTFETNYKNAKAAGLKVGVYLYSYATDTAYAKKEANALVALLKSKSLDLPVFYDLESAELRSASATVVQGVSDAFKTIVEKAGFTFAIYCDESFYNSKSHFVGYDSNVEFWVAKYGKNDGKQYTLPSIKHHLIAHQFSSNGSVSGISGHVDVSEWYGAATSTTTKNTTSSINSAKVSLTEAELRKKVAEWGVPYVGIKEGSAEHKKILAFFNDSGLFSYKVKETDAWCQTFGSTVGIALGLTDIIPVECSCGRAIEIWKKMGRWKEDDSYVPSVGDYIYYDWQDDGIGDNTGWPDHVGIVYSVNGNDLVIIEGNYKDSVGYRNMKVNGKYIRGYGLPNYASKVANTGSTTTKQSTVNGATSTAKKIATDSAAGMLKSLAGTYKVTANNLNVRSGAGTNKAIMVTIPKGTAVQNYGYYTTYNGVKWLYVQFTYKNVQYTGFASGRYLERVSKT